MKSLPLFALLLSNILMYAQNETPAPIGFKRLYVGVSTMQGVCYRFLHSNPKVAAADGIEELRDYIISSRNASEKPGYAANGGIRIGVNATKFFAVESGVLYSYNSYSANSGNLIYGSQWNGNGYDATLPDSIYLPSSVKFVYAYHHLTLPVSLNFALGNKKVRALISTGANFDVLVKATTASYWDNEPATKGNTWDITSSFHRFSISPFLGIGIDYQINSLMSLRIMPIAQFQALPNVQGAPITERLYSGGINIALNFGFIDVQAKERK